MNLQNNLKKILLLSLFLLTIIPKSNPIFSQSKQENIVSLKTSIQKTQNPEEKIKLLNKIAIKYNDTNLDSALYYARTALKLSLAFNNSELLAASYYALGISLRNMGIVDSTYYFLRKSLMLFEKLNDIQNTIKLHIAIGEYYRANYFLQKAILSEYKAISISYRSKTMKLLPAAYNRLSSIYFELSFNNAFKDSVYPDTLHKTILLIDSSIYWSKYLDTKDYNVSNFNILGACYKELKEYRKANEYLSLALTEADIYNELIEKPMIYRNISMNFMKLKQFDKAMEFAKKGAAVSLQLGLNSSLYQNYYAIVLIAEKIQNAQIAYEYLSKADSVKYIVNNEISIAKAKEFDIKFKSKENELLIEQQKHDIEKKQHQFILILLGLILVIFVAIASFLFIIRIRKINRLLEKKNTEVELAHCKLSKLTQFKDDLTGMIVHDLKNPLNTIINLSKIINNSVTTIPDNVKEKNKNIENSAFNMLHIVNNILDLQKFEEAKITLQLSENFIKDTLQNALQHVELLLSQKNITIINKINGSIKFSFDNNLIERVLVNLLTNAIKFSPNNEIIIIESCITEYAVEISITDKGPGIPEDIIPLLFEKYARSEIRKIGFSNSTGLGLAFSKFAVQAHNGEIGVNSVYGNGACFWFTLNADNLTFVEKKSKIKTENKTIVFSDKFLKSIVPLKEILITFNFYNTGDILMKINNFPCNDPEFALWKKQVESAVLFSNKDQFYDLIKI